MREDSEVFSPGKIPAQQPPAKPLSSCFNKRSVPNARRHRMIRRLFPILCTFILFSSSAFSQAVKVDRQVAITIDDLPAGMADRLPAADITALTSELLGTLRDQK